MTILMMAPMTTDGWKWVKTSGQLYWYIKMPKDDAILTNSDQRNFRSQPSDLWTDAATVERRVRRKTGRREEVRSHKRERDSGERRSKCEKR